MEGLRVGIVQFAPGSDAGRNREYLHVPLLGAAVADLVVLPEYSAFYHPDPTKWAAGAEAMDGPFVSFLLQHAKRSGATIIAGFLEKSGDNLYNTVVAVGPNGLLGRYRKIHLYDAFGAKESDVITAGSAADAPVVIDFVVSADAMVWPMVPQGVSNSFVQYVRDHAPSFDGED